MRILNLKNLVSQFRVWSQEFNAETNANFKVPSNNILFERYEKVFDVNGEINLSFLKCFFEIFRNCLPHHKYWHDM